MLTQNNQLMCNILQQFFLYGDQSRQAQGQFSRAKDSLVYCFHNNLLEKNRVTVAEDGRILCRASAEDGDCGNNRGEGPPEKEMHCLLIILHT